jgi:CubicO group peptidase (beta-lactamase class C family)
MTEGTCHDRFAGVRTQFEANFASGDDVGASVCVIHDGEVVVDLWGGVGDDVNGVSRPWQSDSIINVWSTTKTMGALVMLMLHDRNVLDLDAPVATYWPEFAAAGKEGVLVRHVLGHSAGLSGIATPVTAEDYGDHDLIVKLLAEQAPWWEPGTASGYHAITQGYLENEIVRRTDGRTLGTFFAEEVAGPIGADFHIGTPAAHDQRVLRVIPPSAPLSGDPDPTSIAYRTFSNPALGAEVSWTEWWRRAEIPAAGGHGNARSVAMAQAAISHGGAFNGVRLLSPETIDRIFDVQAYGRDHVLAAVMKLGIGYGLPCPELPISPNERACFWGGWGGSIIIHDLPSRTTFSYVMNRMGEGTTGDMRGAGLLLQTYASLAA